MNGIDIINGNQTHIFFQPMNSSQTDTHAPAPDNEQPGLVKIFNFSELPAFNEKIDLEGLRKLFRHSGMAADDNDSLKDIAEERLETLRAIAAIKRRLHTGAGKLDASAVTELIANGFSLEKIGFGMLSDVMNNMQVAAPKPLTDDILAEAKNKAESISGLDDGAVAHLLQAGGTPTLGQVYAAKHATANTAVPKAAAALDEELKEILLSEIKKRLSAENVTISAEAIDTAYFLIANELDITNENVKNALFLKNFDNETNKRQIIAQIAHALMYGEDVNNTPLFAVNPMEQTQTLLEDYAQVLEMLPLIQPEKVDELTQAHVPLTLENLIQPFVQLSLTQDAALSEPVDNLAAITAKRELAEIQLKLTMQAAARLAHKNIDINTMPLREALAHLRRVESEMHREKLALMGAEPTNENVRIMDTLYQRLAEMNPLTNNVFGGLLHRTTAFTVTGIHEAVTAAVARAAQGYDVFATVPNPKYGDAFAQVKGQFAPLLDELGIEPTAQNIKAASILSKNEIDVTAERVAEVQLLDAKIDYAQNKLHPNIAASLIKEGFNPMDMHIDELIAYIDRFNDIFGKTTRDQIASHMLVLDRQKQLEAPQREAVLAIYRMLNAVERYGGAALGTLLKNETSLTLGSMLEASKYYGKTRGRESLLDFDVDDGFGMLEEVAAGEGHVASIFAELEVFAYKRFTEQANPPALSAYINSTPDYTAQTMAQAAEALEAFNETEAEIRHAEKVAEIDEHLSQLREMFGAKATTIHLMDAHGIATTPAVVNMLSALRKDPFFIGSVINDLSEMLSGEARETLESIIPETNLAALSKSSPTALSEAISNTLEDLKNEAGTSALLRAFTLAQNALLVQRHCQTVSGGADIKLPIKLHDKIASLNVFFMRENTTNKTEKTTLIALNTTHLGRVQIVAEMGNAGVSLAVQGESKEAVARLKADRTRLEAILHALGFHDLQINFSVKEAANTLERVIMPRADLPIMASKYKAVV